MRLGRYASLWASLSVTCLVNPSFAFDCKIQANGIDYDLTPIGGLQTAAKQTETPPTTSTAKVRMDLCSQSGLPKEDDLSDVDQCGGNTRVCLQLFNHKEEASDPDRVTSVIPLWKVDTPEQDVRVTALGTNGRGGLQINVRGPDYASMEQNLNLTLQCDTSTNEGNPSFVSYGGNSLTLEWITSAACPRSGDGAVPPPDEESSKKRSGSGFGGFLKFLFWATIVGLILYFAIGAFYNHQQYSAKGWDMIPHRDFWREFPVLVQDLVSHVIAGLRGQHGGGGRGGYSSLG